jgi:hypothetical protein
MAKYVSESPRLTVKFINADTEELLFETKDRTWMTIGECLTDYFIDTIMKTEMKNKKMPKNLMILVVKEISLVE